MKSRPEQLADQLQKSIAPIYVISGDEPLIIQECCDQIIAATKQQGFTERRIFNVESGFSWLSLLEANQSMSLFSERQLFDCRIPTGKPGKEGADILKKYVQTLNPDNVLLIRLPKIEQAAQRSKWYTALEKAGVAVVVWPIKAQQFPQWIQQRARHYQLNIDKAAINLLANQTAGNLLAAHQTLIKLQLTHDTQPIDAEGMADALSDHSRFSVFELVDCALQGNRTEACRILKVLKAEGTEPTIILWALARETRLMAEVSFGLQQGISFSELSKQQGIWQNRQTLVKTACQRQAVSYWQTSIKQAANIDKILKGGARGNTWDALLDLTLRLTGQPLLDVA